MGVTRMRCEHVQDRILESLLAGDAELPAGIQPHVDRCPECAAELEAMRRGVTVTRLMPQMSVEPPKGMKSAVLAAIAGTETQRTPVPQAPRQVERSRSLGEILHALMLRPLPVAAAVAVLVIGTLGVYAGTRYFEVREANAIVETVRGSSALANLDTLEMADWVQETAVHRNTVAEAKLHLQRLGEASDNPKEVNRVVQGLEEKRLVEAFRALVHAAPAGADQDRRMASEVLMVLEDIQHGHQ